MTEPPLPQESIFLQALEIAPAERAAFLDRACAGDRELRADVEGLLRAHNRSGGLLDIPETRVCPAGEPEQDRPGGVVGGFKLLQQIGEGGMGTVFAAEQTHPVRRQVALKVVKPGMDSRQVVARFGAERQALALMDHPNIARVYDAGTTDSGRPFFVMELVHGVPITQFCDERRLTPRDRVGLFVQVCQAVQHAHQKGVIHRDIKPSNVLVALYADRAVPKVIDFGVAKAVGPKLTEDTLFTECGQTVGTLEYMSPEQAEVNQLDIDTRSDIYALGVLLYELLAGSPPFSRKDLEKAGLLEMLRVIREQEPSKPSTKLSAAEGLPTLAANRGTEPAKLTRLVRGELDWIVMKALEKDRNRRYQTANGLAMDVQRYLADEPVLACPPSAGYRLRKFGRRNRRVLATVTLVGVLLVAAIIALAVSNAQTRAEYRRAEAEAGRARTNLRLAFEVLDEIYMQEVADRLSHDPDAVEENEHLLTEGLRFYELFAQQNEADPTVRREVAKAHHRAGQIYRALGQDEKAVPHFDRAAEVYEQLIAADPADLELRFLRAVLCTDRANLLEGWVGDVQKSRDERRKGIELLEPLIREPSLDPKYQYQVAVLYQHQGMTFWRAGDLAEAEKHFRKAIGLSEGLAVRVADVQTRVIYVIAISYSHANLGLVLTETGRPTEAEDELRQTIAMLTQAHKDASAVPGFRRGTLPRFRRSSPIQRDFGSAHNNLANVLRDKGRSRAAEKEWGKAVDYYDQVVKDWPRVPEHRRDLARIERAFGGLLFDGNKRTEATAHVRRSIELLTQLNADFPGRLTVQEELGYSLAAMGDLLTAEGDPQKAEEHYRRALEFKERVLAQQPDIASHNNELAWFLTDCRDLRFRDPGRALVLAQKAVTLTRGENGSYLNTLGVVQYRLGECKAAVAALQRAQQRHGEGDDGDWLYLAMAYWKLREKQKAHDCYDRAVNLLSAFEYPPESSVRLRAEAAQLLEIDDQKQCAAGNKRPVRASREVSPPPAGIAPALGLSAGIGGPFMPRQTT
jgi:serine/threonine protein kinase/tetratricopeptide (TPR) repeat protein